MQRNGSGFTLKPVTWWQFLVPRSERTYRIENKEFRRLPVSHVNAIYPDALTRSIWFATVDVLIRFDPQSSFEQPATFRTLIRGVRVNGEWVDIPELKSDKNQLPALPFNRRSIRFSFAAPFYEAEQDTLYQCRLEGYDPEWTPWSNETKKYYTNLEPGLNVFRVRSKNIYGHIGEEAVFRFELLPPWYRSWWAYLLYTLAMLLLIMLFVRWRSSKLRQEKQQLEALVAQRTQEINSKNKQLQEMAKIKSNFFANISYEFRTPLTLILGPLEQMLASTTDLQQQKKINLMQRNAHMI